MGGLRELLREHEKGVLRAAHPRTPFQGEYHPPGDQHGNNPVYYRLQMCTTIISYVRGYFTEKPKNSWQFGVFYTLLKEKHGKKQAWNQTKKSEIMRENLFLVQCSLRTDLKACKRMQRVTCLSEAMLKNYGTIMHNLCILCNANDVHKYSIMLMTCTRCTTGTCKCKNNDIGILAKIMAHISFPCIYLMQRGKRWNMLWS